MPGDIEIATLRRPDDWHVHLRDGEMLGTVLPHTARQFARAIVMPNLVPPVATVAAARLTASALSPALRPHPTLPRLRGREWEGLHTADDVLSDRRDRSPGGGAGL
jgi:hypothetical protein